MISKVLIGAIASVFIAGSIFFVGCKRHHCHGEKMDWIVKRITSKLDLTDSQKAKLEKIRDEIKAKRKEHRSSREEVFNKLLTQIKGDKVDTAKVNRLLESKEKEWKEFRPFLVAKAAEFHAVLTPRQRTIAYEKIKEFHDKHHKRCGQ